MTATSADMTGPTKFAGCAMMAKIAVGSDSTDEIVTSDSGDVAAAEQEERHHGGDHADDDRDPGRLGSDPIRAQDAREHEDARDDLRSRADPCETAMSTTPPGRSPPLFFPSSILPAGASTGLTLASNPQPEAADVLRLDLEESCPWSGPSAR